MPPKKKSRVEGHHEGKVARNLHTGHVDPDLPMTPDGVIYHLACKKADIADKFILVGDPGRVPIVAERFDKGSIEFSGCHREINVITGKYKGVRVTVFSTGMGTDNVEICINEVHALKEYCYATNKWLSDKDRPVGKIALIRVGTCGSPVANVAVGSLAITRHGIGMDNTCRYYQNPNPQTFGERNLEKAANLTALGKVGVYATSAHPDVTAAIAASCDAFNAEGAKKNKDFAPQKYIVGTTASGSGFYGCQGRAVGKFRGHLTCPNLVDDLGGITFRTSEADKKATERVVNLEMENSALCFLSNCLGYKAGTVCCIVAARSGESRDFATPEVAANGIKNAITIALNALLAL